MIFDSLIMKIRIIFEYHFLYYLYPSSAVIIFSYLCAKRISSEVKRLISSQNVELLLNIIITESFLMMELSISRLVSEI